MPVELLIVTPVGAPVWLNVGAGLPVAVTVKEPPIPCTTDVLFAEVMFGATSGAVTVNVKFCVKSGLTLLVAVTVNG